MAGEQPLGLRGKDRLIVALDVPEVDQALDLVNRLDNVSCFKVGWRLFMATLRTGNIRALLDSLAENRKDVFFDLKVPDIGNTVASVVADLRESNVKFLTLHEDTSLENIRMAREARGAGRRPELLRVPFLSSQDELDLASVDPMAVAQGLTLNQWLLKRAEDAIEAGCDGLIASGQAIALFRQRWPTNTGVTIVSPGIRPHGTSHHDHKRFTTPAEAIRLGSDYLVVGRPILNAEHPREAAQAIIEEIDRALNSGPSATSTRGSISAHGAAVAPMYAKPSGGV